MGGEVRGIDGDEDGRRRCRGQIAGQPGETGQLASIEQHG